jgi:hypothetical protein
MKCSITVLRQAQKGGFLKEGELRVRALNPPLVSFSCCLSQNRALIQDQVLVSTGDDNESANNQGASSRGLRRSGRSAGPTQRVPLKYLVTPNQISGFVCNLITVREDVDRMPLDQQPLLFGPSADDLARLLLSGIVQLQENPDQGRQSFGDEKTSASITDLALGDLVDGMHLTRWDW